MVGTWEMQIPMYIMLQGLRCSLLTADLDDNANFIKLQEVELSLLALHTVGACCQFVNASIEDFSNKG